MKKYIYYTLASSQVNPCWETENKIELLSKTQIWHSVGGEASWWWDSKIKDALDLICARWPLISGIPGPRTVGLTNHKAIGKHYHKTNTLQILCNVFGAPNQKLQIHYTLLESGPSTILHKTLGSFPLKLLTLIDPKRGRQFVKVFMQREVFLH